MISPPNQINEDINLILKKILSTISKSNVESIYLFGSIARGNITSKSDYDIAIIVKKYPKNDLSLISNIKCSLMDKVKRPLDIIILEPDDLKTSPQFLYELYNNNKKLFGQDTIKKFESIAKKSKPAKPVLKREPVWYYA